MSSKSANSRRAGGDATILLVDDEPPVLEIAVACLEHEAPEFEVITATSVEEAMSTIERETPDVIVSDYRMAGEDGLEFLAQVRRRWDHTPFILFTSMAREEFPDTLPSTLTDYQQKSIGVAQFSVLATRIRCALERSTA